MDVELHTTESSTPLDPEEEIKKDVLKYFGFQAKRDSASDARNVLLIVAALIAAVTFDKGTDVPEKIQNQAAKIVFVVGNTVAFSTSMLIIESLTLGFPFKRHLQISIFFSGFAYAAGVVSHLKGVAEVVLLYTSLLAPLLIGKASTSY